MSLRKFVMVVGAVGVAGGLAFGCSSSTTVTDTGDSGTSDASSGGISDAKPDKVAPTGDGATSSGGDSGQNACVPLTTLGSFTPHWVPPAAHQDACTQQNIDDFLKFCLGSSPDANACNSFTSSANGAKCVKCLQTADSAAAYGPLIAHQTQGTVELNIAGCVSLAMGDTSANSCGAKYLALSECGNAACVNCPSVTDQASLDALNTCTSDAENGVCSQYSQPASCIDQQVEAGNAAVANCVNGSSFEAVYTNIAPLFCLSTGDGGADSGG